MNTFAICTKLLIFLKINDHLFSFHRHKTPFHSSYAFIGRGLALAVAIASALNKSSEGSTSNSKGRAKRNPVIGEMKSTN